MAQNLWFVGSICMLVGYFLILLAAFREEVFWGFICLFFPISILFFVIINWEVAKRGAITMIMGFGFFYIAIFVL
jgi:hypothetical protein